MYVHPDILGFDGEVCCCIYAKFLSELYERIVYWRSFLTMLSNFIISTICTLTLHILYIINCMHNNNKKKKLRKISLFLCVKFLSYLIFLFTASWWLHSGRWLSCLWIGAQRTFIQMQKSTTWLLCWHWDSLSGKQS